MTGKFLAVDEGGDVSNHALLDDGELFNGLRGRSAANEDENPENKGEGCPLKLHLGDPEITEILVNGHREIWIEREGRLEKSQFSFSSEDSLRRYLRSELLKQRRKIDHLNPFTNCVTAEGFRIHAVIPPIARAGICLSIRKPQKGGWSLENLQKKKMFGDSCMRYLVELINARKNIFICGGTGSGKTSLLGALIGGVAKTERVICLEDVAEIQSSHPHVIQMEARPANQEGEGEQSLRTLLKESLRMRPDRLVLGECRGAEALELLMALNSGHSGSMATIHANSARDALARLEFLSLIQSPNLNESAVKFLIASCISCIIFLEKINGSRMIVSVAEIKGIDSGRYLLKEVKF